MAVGKGWYSCHQTFKEPCKTSRCQCVLSAVLVLCKTSLCSPSLPSKREVSMHLTGPLDTAPQLWHLTTIGFVSSGFWEWEEGTLQILFSAPFLHKTSLSLSSIDSYQPDAKLGTAPLAVKLFLSSNTCCSTLGTADSKCQKENNCVNRNGFFSPHRWTPNIFKHNLTKMC